jgi:hypothetical protein
MFVEIDPRSPEDLDKINQESGKNFLPHPHLYRRAVLFGKQIKFNILIAINFNNNRARQ